MRSYFEPKLLEAEADDEAEADSDDRGEIARRRRLRYASPHEHGGRMKLSGAARYRLTCFLLGVVLGWAPWFLHGPIPEKFNLHYIKGAVAVWAFYLTRMLIGFWVGITSSPRAWYLRGPLVGFAAMFPLTFISLATPECGPPCMAVNLTSASTIGLVVAGAAFALTGKNHHSE